MHQIRYFLAVCETLNFTRAAEKCNVAQPSLTRAVKTLEEELGGPLFHRERANTHLTDLGRLMRPHLEQVLAETEAAKMRARSFTKLDSAELTVGLMCTIGPTRMVGLMRQFQDRYPNVQLKIQDAGARAIQEQLAGGQIDVALYGLPGEIDDRFQARTLYSERFVIAFASGHKFERLNAVPVRELAGQRFVRRAQCEFLDYMRKVWREQGVTVQDTYTTDREDWVQAMVLSGLGFTDLPEYSVTMPGIRTRPLVDPEVQRQIQIVTVRGRPHTPAVAAFVREAVSYGWSTDTGLIGGT